MSVLEAGGLHLAYSGPRRRPWSRPVPVPVLSGVSLRIPAGETLGLVGASGSGKSTILRVLLALEQPDQGMVSYDGEAVRPGRRGGLLWFRRRVQYVPQDPGSSLDPRRSVEQLIREPLRCLRVPGNHRTLVREALDRVDLGGGLLSKRPGELSGGQNQRVALARALASSPAFVLADEPVSGLDLPLRDQMLQVLQELTADQGLGLLFVSHDLGAVRQLCARTAILSGGRIVEEGPTVELLSRPGHSATRELARCVPQLSHNN